jgi:hypothetical protein
MKNVPLSKEGYGMAREFLRANSILYRDMRNASQVPAWSECLCLADEMYQSMSPGQKAWLELKREYPKVNLHWREEELKWLRMSPPKLFRPYQGYIAGLDLRSAYRQIYSRLFLHAEWPNKRLKYPLAGIAERLQDHKPARNAVVGIAISTRNKWVQGDRVWYQAKINRYLSPVLWAQIQTMLHQIASQADVFGAIHVNTDGFAFDNDTARDRLADWLTGYGVEFRTYQGWGRVPGLNSLIIPGVKEPANPHITRAKYHIEYPEFDILTWWSKLS